MFTKIFESVFDSSIADNWQHRHVFTDLLVLADKYGVVDMTAEAVARRTNVPIEIIREAITALESPDPNSRTPDCEGRRIVRLDTNRPWGWRIVNYVKYRESATKEMLRMSEAERKRAYRACHNHSPSPTPPTSEKQIQKQREKQNSPATVPDTSRTTQDAGGTVPDAPPRFEPVKLGLYRREYQAMIRDAKEAIKAIRSKPENYVRDLSDRAVELIQWLRKEAKPDCEPRVKEIVAREDSYERTELKPTAAAIVDAWRARIKEIENAQAGIK